MSLFDELFADILGESRPVSPKVAPESPAENGSTMRVIAQSPESPALGDEKVAPTGDTPCTTCGCGSLWRDTSGAWHCERCEPPGNAHVTTWRNFLGAKAPQGPRTVEPWPTDMDRLLSRVATHFEWSQEDRRDFRQWARRDQQGIVDARQFLEHEVANLPTPGLSDLRRVVLNMLARDPSIRYAWTCADDGADPVILTLAIRGKGTCDLAIPRANFNALALPQLIAELTKGDAA